MTTASPLRHGLRAAVSATLLAALAVAAVLTSSGPAAVPTAAAAPDTGASVAELLGSPSFPELDVPDVPLPRETQAEPAVVYTCDPWGDPEFGDPSDPNLITNKDCPDLIDAKEQAQQDYLDQLRNGSPAGTEDEVGDWRESACSDPSSGVYGTPTCGPGLDVTPGSAID